MTDQPTSSDLHFDRPHRASASEIRQLAERLDGISTSLLTARQYALRADACGLLTSAANGIGRNDGATIRQHLIEMMSLFGERGSPVSSLSREHLLALNTIDFVLRCVGALGISANNRSPHESRAMGSPPTRRRNGRLTRSVFTRPHFVKAAFAAGGFTTKGAAGRSWELGTTDEDTLALTIVREGIPIARLSECLSWHVQRAWLVADALRGIAWAADGAAIGPNDKPGGIPLIEAAIVVPIVADLRLLSRCHDVLSTPVRERRQQVEPVLMEMLHRARLHLGRYPAARLLDPRHSTLDELRDRVVDSFVRYQAGVAVALSIVDEVMASDAYSSGPVGRMFLPETPDGSSPFC